MKSLRVHERLGGPTADSDYFGQRDRVAEDGTFKLTNLIPDRYGVVVNGLPDGYYIKSIRVGETEITYSGFELRDGPPARIDVLVSPKAATVSGVAKIRDTDKTAAGATVVLVPSEKERAQIAEYYYHATTNQFGRFEFKSVSPGEYTVYAWEDVESTAWMDPEFMKPLEGMGESVTLGESDRANVQVNLIPAESEKDKATTTGKAQP
jgi:hypothetical protein